MENKIITIASIEKIETDKIKLRDQDKVLYTLWKHKHDGDQTKAYAFYETLPNQGIGFTAECGFEIKESKGISYRTILVLRESKSKTVPIVSKEEIKAEKEADKPNWDKITAEKNGNIRWLNALNNATAIVCAYIHSGHWNLPEGTTNSEKIGALASEIYLLTPPMFDDKGNLKGGYEGSPFE